jgi:hypothetical protein
MFPQVCLLLKYVPQTDLDHDNRVAILLLVKLNNSMRSFRALLLRWPAIFIALPMTLAAQTSMKAIVIHQNGGPEVLKYEDAPRPAKR